MDDRFSRTRMLLGGEAMRKLKGSRVAVFGIGGVGGYVVEALARSGVGTLDLIDDDEVVLSNLNRQIIATMDTIGLSKVEAAAKRVLSINPEAVVHTHKCFYLPETAGQFDFSLYDYVVDAIDTVTGKIQLILQAQAAGVPVISAMGAGNKLDPSRFEVADIYATSIDPLARVMRRELRKRGVRSLKVVYSKEQPRQPSEKEDRKEGLKENSQKEYLQKEYLQKEYLQEEYLQKEYLQKEYLQKEDSKEDRPREQLREQEPPVRPWDADRMPFRETSEEAPAGSAGRRAVPGSIAFVPSVAGLIIAGEVVRDLTGLRG